MTTIYHNPRCSKSRQTLALLTEQGIDPDIILYLEQPPSAIEIANICTQLDRAPVTLIRHKEAIFKTLNLNIKDQRSDADWCRIMADNPILIERPIVLHKDKACIGRPPENILTIL